MGDSPALIALLEDGLSPRYHIERELGRGGMATVFLARDTVHDRLVAIKVLHPEIAAGVSTERFLREIHLLAALQHPHILPLYDSGAVNEIPYYVMPFVAGESLRDRLNRDGRIPVPLALRMTSEAAAALDYAHRQGIVHRDIKPENILLSDDHVIVADFGIARAAAQSVDDRITGTSVVIGTPAYMSPEQATGDGQLDGRSDIYSLACVLFEAISGKAPFTGTTPASVIASRFSRPATRVSELVPGVSRTVESVLASALSLSPADRPQSAAEFSSMLFAEVPQSKGGWDRRVAAIAAVLLIIVIAGSVFAIKARQEADDNSTVKTDPVSTRIATRRNDPVAHDLYLQGLKIFEVPSDENGKKALALFKAAIERDSLYPEAWAGLADAHSSNGVGNYVATPPRPEFEQARFAAKRALELDSTLAEAHTALALVQMMYDYDWKGASLSLDKAQAIDPGYEYTYLYRGFLLAWLGKVDSAVTVSREALHMNPQSFRLRQSLGRAIIQTRQYADAEKELRADLQVEPRNARLKMLLAEVLIAEGKPTEAVSRLEEAQQGAPDGTRFMGYRVAAYASAGRRRDAQLLLDSLVARSDRSFVPAMDIAIAFAGMRDIPLTLTWLERAYTDRTLRPILRDPVFDVVKNEPRYQALLRKLNLNP